MNELVCKAMDNNCEECFRKEVCIEYLDKKREEKLSLNLQITKVI